MHVRPVQPRRKPLAWDTLNFSRAVDLYRLAIIFSRAVDLYRLAINLVCFLPFDWHSWSVSFLKLFRSPPAWSRQSPSPHWRRKTPKSCNLLQTSPHSTNLRSRWQISSFSNMLCHQLRRSRSWSRRGSLATGTGVEAQTSIRVYMSHPPPPSLSAILLKEQKTKGRREKPWQEHNLRIVRNKKKREDRGGALKRKM